MSVVVAVLVGGIQLANLIEQQGVGGSFMRETAALQAHFVVLGGGIAVLLASCWGVAVLMARSRRVRAVAATQIAHRADG